MKAQRKIGAKVALAARVDSAGSSPDGSFGLEMVDKLERELERLAKPSLKKVVKALPRPDEKKKARRGGKRLVSVWMTGGGKWLKRFINSPQRPQSQRGLRHD